MAPRSQERLLPLYLTSITTLGSLLFFGNFATPREGYSRKVCICIWMFLSQISLYRLLAFPCEIFPFRIHTENADNYNAWVFHIRSYAIFLNQGNSLSSQVSKRLHQGRTTGALLPVQSLCLTGLDCQCALQHSSAAQETLNDPLRARAAHRSC